MTYVKLSNQEGIVIIIGISKKFKYISSCFILSSLLTGCASIQGFVGEINNVVEKDTVSMNDPEALEDEELEEVSTIDYASPISLPHSQSLDLITYEKMFEESLLTPKQLFPEKYTDIDGILTYRGNNFRDSASFGTVDIEDFDLDPIWEFTTGKSDFGAGAGWTGQPAIVKWPDDVKQIMNIRDKFKVKDDFVEVVYASLDGRVYFFDLETGEPSRDSINTGNPIKGSVSIDPRGYPILYVGHGVPEKKELGHKIFSLIDSSLLYFVNGVDPLAYRKWGAFDSSPIINKDTDSFIVGGENGLFYNIKLNTDFNVDAGTIALSPEEFKYRYVVKGNHHQGIENSVVSFKNLAYFADNGGSIQCVDLNTMEPKWVWHGETADDTNASLVLDFESDVPYLYVGTEQDVNVNIPKAHFKKLNGLTGEMIWEKGYSTHPVHGLDGGFYATAVNGKKDISNLVIVPFSGHEKGEEGLLTAYDKETGESVWSWDMPDYTWSSPVAVYDKGDKSYIIQCDSSGKMNLLEGTSGKILNSVELGSNIEASPAVYNNMVVVATRGGKMYGVKIK